MGEFFMSPDAEGHWPGGPQRAFYLLAVVEHIEGRARACSRTRRLPEKSLPAYLQASEEEQFDATTAAVDAMHRRRGA